MTSHSKNVIARAFHRGVAPVWMPAGTILFFAYAYIGALLMFPGRGLPRHSHIGSLEGWVGLLMVAQAVWLAAGYYEYISDRHRKCGYLVGGCITAWLSATLYADGSYLSGGLIGLMAMMSILIYWRFPSRHEVAARATEDDEE